jgi:hypothetical protein
MISKVKDELKVLKMNYKVNIYEDEEKIRITDSPFSSENGSGNHCVGHHEEEDKEKEPCEAVVANT